MWSTISTTDVIWPNFKATTDTDTVSKWAWKESISCVYVCSFFIFKKNNRLPTGLHKLLKMVFLLPTQRGAEGGKDTGLWAFHCHPFNNVTFQETVPLLRLKWQYPLLRWVFREDSQTMYACNIPAELDDLTNENRQGVIKCQQKTGPVSPVMTKAPFFMFHVTLDGSNDILM